MANNTRSSEPRRERIITHYSRNKNIYRAAGVVGLLGLGALGMKLLISDPERSRLEEQLQSTLHQLNPQAENVLCDSVAEKFYIINGDTAYVEVEGMKINDYFERARRSKK
ncbi:MAG: hypothetical protein Q8P79_00825 [Nanoarchaeota archaeon]|nr:hypothetical protein [Nanoarchaeota archaeon]